MHRFRDLRITSHALDASEIIGFIEIFAQSTPGWSFPKEKSLEYATDCGGTPSCCLIHEPTTLPRAAIHLTLYKEKRKPGGIYVPNIIPLDRDSMSSLEYNGIALLFARELRLRARREEVSIQVVLSKPEVRLRDIVGGKVTWKLFQRYVRLFPQSHHPNDLARLDAFTCALSRYSKRRFDLEAFEFLLCEELGWSRAMASRCKTRVEIGLEVLAASRAFIPR
jgi:hypothetical protein